MGDVRKHLPPRPSATLKQWKFICELAKGLLHNSKDTVALCSQAKEQLMIVPTAATGTDIHLVLTEIKRKFTDGTITKHQYQGRSTVCKETNFK